MRATADIDILESRGTDLATLASWLAAKARSTSATALYIDVVAIADVPDNDDERLITAPASFANLRLRVFERHDLVLAKIVRNNDRDRADLAAIAGGPGLDIDLLRARYVEALRPKLGRPEREDLTLTLWIEIIEETKQRNRG